MSTNYLELHFAGRVDVQLMEARFQGPLTTNPVVTVRGKTPGAIKNAGNFQWTFAVRALCALCIKSVLAHHDESQQAIGYLFGFQGSLAASLDHALSKQPIWVSEFCGLDAQGNAYLKRLILRTNPERKRPGPVILGLNHRLIAAQHLRIHWNGEVVQSRAELEKLLSFITNGDEPRKEEATLCSLLQKQAA